MKRTFQTLLMIIGVVIMQLNVNAQTTTSVSGCFGETKQLTGPAGESWAWFVDGDSIEGENSQQFIYICNEEGKHTITCKVYKTEITTENNMMANGDYEIVPDCTMPEWDSNCKPTNLGFESDYLYGGFNWPNGNYYETYPGRNTLYLITSNAQTHYWRDFAAVTPHGGNYFAMFDGGTTMGYAWRTNSDIVAALNDPKYPALELTKGTTYYFSYWAVHPQKCDPGNSAILQFTIQYKNADGTKSEVIELGEPNDLGNQPVGQWMQTTVTWVSPVDSKWVEIGVYDLGTAANGNDFGLDDICFQNSSQVVRGVVASSQWEIDVQQCTTPPPPPNPKECKNVVYRKWDDVLFVDNSDDLYVSYQWYEMDIDGSNTLKLEGETKQYLYDENVKLQGNGKQYWCVMKRADNGKTDETCAHLFEDFPQSAVYNPGEKKQAPVVYPMPLRRMSKAQIKNVDADATVVLYNALGQEIDSWEGTEFTILTPGYYILKITDSTGQYAKRIIVE